MAAPKNNEFHKLRLKVGSEPKYTPETLGDTALKYFEYIKKNPFYQKQAFAYKGEITVIELPIIKPYTILGFCNFAGIVHNTYLNYKKKNKAYLRVITRIEEIILNQKFEGAASNIFNSNIISRDLGLIDKQQKEENVNMNINLTPAKIKQINDILENEC